MKIKKLEKIFDETNSNWEGDNALQGLNIIAKYYKPDETVLEAAEHEQIYSVDVDDILERGLTEEDARKLASLNWMIEEDSLSCFV